MKLNELEKACGTVPTAVKASRYILTYSKRTTGNFDRSGFAAVPMETYISAPTAPHRKGSDTRVLPN